ncbi:GNAT family N-acetyltransferase [Levilactobacillus fujinensis]|uniref:GNAT family N-acetyltransferase n=1 Tax=Levilactobacillus fujinensis TaxID=2486024 RepID=A0ABW1TEG3_9LACO|nr:GNAT family N-acetyltransferase [Levilactobacillus fujinensis]
MVAYTFTRTPQVTDQEILGLYRSVDWTAYLQHPQNTLAALTNSTVLWATVDDHLIGLIRGVTDGHTILYIQDLLVNPTYQKQHVGTTLMKKMLDRYQNVGQTVLITDPEARTLKFYESLDFLKITPQTYGRAFVLERRF